MNDLVERVAAAIERQPFSATPEEIARAAISAMREPTDAMLAAFSSWATPIGYTAEGWRAAIDEALKT